MLAGDKITSIKTENYDVKLLKQNIKDEINGSTFPLEFQDTKRLVGNTNTAGRNVLGLTVMVHPTYIQCDKSYLRVQRFFLPCFLS